MLELLAQQERELQDLRKEVADKEAALADRRIRMESAGSIAEAALKINEVFEAAQRAAEQYLESLKAAKPQEAPKECSPDEEPEV